MLKTNKVFLLGMIILTGMASLAHAQSDAETEVASGVVTAVSRTSITIMDTIGEVSVTVSINAETIFENIESVDEIKEGDDVYIDYTIAGQGYIAVNIYKMGDDDEMDEEDNYESSDIEDINTLEESYDESEEEK